MDGSMTKRELTEHDFLNPAFVRSYQNADYVLNNRAVVLSYVARSIVATTRMAFENDSSGLPMENRGVEQTLEVAESIIEDLINEVELLTRTRDNAD